MRRDMPIYQSREAQRLAMRAIHGGGAAVWGWTYVFDMREIMYAHRRGDMRNVVTLTRFKEVEK